VRNGAVADVRRISDCRGTVRDKISQRGDFGGVGKNAVGFQTVDRFYYRPVFLQDCFAFLYHALRSLNQHDFIFFSPQETVKLGYFLSRNDGAAL
jgi:hypothetical protein